MSEARPVVVIDVDPDIRDALQDPMTCCGWRLIRIEVRIATVHFWS
jgi:hypothetical protein